MSSNFIPTLEFGGGLTSVEKSVIKRKCDNDYLFFCRYFMRHRESSRFIVNWHHLLIADSLMKVWRGETKNLVINVSPGSSKTELAVVNFIAWCLKNNPWCRFLHISYSDDLALTNSKKAKDLIESEEYQELWPLNIANDSKATKRWNVMAKAKNGIKEKIAGGVYAVSLGGQITGFRAGRMVPEFAGAILIDDPLKPEDALSEAKRKAANRKLLSTVKSRKANPNTPIIVIMQRLAQEDPTGFIKAGNLGGQWEYLTIPAMIDDEYVKTLPEHVQKMVDSGEKSEFKEDDDDEVNEKNPPAMKFSYWPYKEPIADLIHMSKGGEDKEGARMSRTVFSGQYQQNPVAPGGNIIKGKWFKYFNERTRPKFIYRLIFADTAMKTEERHDYSVFQCFGMGLDGNIYLTDQDRGKWPAHELKQRFKSFWNKHKKLNDDDRNGNLRKALIEDKASGTGLIQDITKEGGIPVEEIPRDKDRLIRVNDAEPWIKTGHVWLPEDAPWVSDYIKEMEAFTSDDTHDHDDQIDPTCDAVTNMLSSGNKLKQWERLGEQK